MPWRVTLKVGVARQRPGCRRQVQAVCFISRPVNLSRALAICSISSEGDLADHLVGFGIDDLDHGAVGVAVDRELQALARADDLLDLVHCLLDLIAGGGGRRARR